MKSEGTFEQIIIKKAKVDEMIKDTNKLRLQLIDKSYNLDLVADTYRGLQLMRDGNMISNEQADEILKQLDERLEKITDELSSITLPESFS